MQYRWRRINECPPGKPGSRGGWRRLFPLNTPLLLWAFGSTVILVARLEDDTFMSQTGPMSPAFDPDAYVWFSVVEPPGLAELLSERKRPRGEG